MRRRIAVTALLLSLVAGLGLAVNLSGDQGSPQPQPDSPPQVAPASWTPPAMLKGAAFQRQAGEDYTTALNRTEAEFGGLDVVRVFYDSEPDPWPGRAPGRDVIVSFKLPPTEVADGSHDEQMQAWFCTAPTDQRVFWSLWHEPEKKVAQGQFTAAEYRSAFEHLDTIADRCDNPNLIATPIFMTWTLHGDHDRDWRDYMPSADHVDVIGWDVYNDARKSGKYTAPDALLTEAFTISRSMGKPVGIAELGSSKAAHDRSGAERAAWISEMLATMRSHDAVFVAYFDFDWDQSRDYRLQDEASLTAWRNG